ncbi:MAG: hypothetical protein PHY87_04060 [Sphaerochaeta sp.]|nr:hypothetical protein [Sphaerochaeta sp.]
MNKKLVAIALMLWLVVSGIFAAYEVAIPVSVVATLTATKEEFLRHGFTVDDEKFQATADIDNAFVVPAQFTYGYETNARGSFSFRMVVGDFLHEDSGNPSVKIASVKIGTTTGVPVPASEDASAYYEILTRTNANTVYTTPAPSGEVDITIYPATPTSGSTDHLGATINAGEQIGDALAGDYTSTIEIYIHAS